MARRRLFYVLDSLEENEVGDQVANLLSRLSRSRFEPRVVSLGGDGALGRRLRDMKITVHRMELSGVIGALLVVPRLRRALAGLHAEILQTFQPWSGTVAQLAAPRSASVFRWVQGVPPPPTTLEERVQAWVERRASLQRPRRFVASDVSAVQRVCDQYRVDHADVVPQCLDLGPLRRQVNAVSVRDARVRLGLDEGHRALVAVSDFRDRSQTAQLLEGFATARREHEGLRLFVVGRGPEEGAARGHAEELHLEDSVIFLRERQDRATLLRAAELVVEAASWPGWSRPSVEAMAAELPVLRWVQNEDDPFVQGYAARITGPADRFARDVLELLEDPPQRGRLARRALADAQAYDVAAVAERWAELYGD